MSSYTEVIKGSRQIQYFILGEINKDLYQKRESILTQQSSGEGSETGKVHLKIHYDWNTSDLVVIVDKGMITK